MKKFNIICAALLLASVMAAAQTTSSTASVTQPAAGPANLAGLLYASNFAHWTISPTQDGTRWTSPGQCYGTSGGLVFPLFSTSAPITVVDVGVPTNTETVTPTLASYLGSGCSVSLPFTHPHANYYLQSGTLGLQEAMNFAGSGQFVVIVTPDWQTMGGTTGMLTAATAGSHTSLIDARTSAPVTYTCSGTCTAVTPAGGTVTAIGVATANGFSGTSSGGATPSLTISYTHGVFPGSGTYTTAASDAFTVTGATSSSHCAVFPTNLTAAADLLADFVSAVGTNSVTITHSATTASGGTVAILCSAN